jgi:G6PDH family F420-dependent oxidoreductase
MPRGMRIGYMLSSEEHSPTELVEQARMAEDAGFTALWISDHFHPWNDEQGQSPFVWSVIGALGQATSLPVMTGVTCPTVRTHPAVVAQVVATSACLVPGGFRLGVGSGEALNEHITGARWPTAEVRLQMLEEAVQVIRTLFTGERVDHHGRHYTVEDARLYTRPAEPVPILVSGFGPKSIALAARIGDGFISTKPSRADLRSYRDAGGTGPLEGGVKVCWAPTEQEGVSTAHRLWSTQGVPGELAQVLPSPRHFEQASSIVTDETTAQAVACGPDPEKHARSIREYADAGYDTVYIAQMGKRQQEFFDFYTKRVTPLLTDVLE